MLNVDDTVWLLLQPGCITRRDRWVLSDVDICILGRTPCSLSSVELATDAEGHECQQ